MSPETSQTVFKKTWICRNMLICHFGLLTPLAKINKLGSLNKVRRDGKNLKVNKRPHSCIKHPRVSCRPLAFTSYKAFFKKKKRGLAVVSLPHCLNNF